MHEVTADATWRVIEFLSDVHLAPDMPATFETWASHLRDTDADALFILGDLFEVWVGDDSRSAGFESRCVEVLAEAASRRAMFFMVGNRDFLVGEALLSELGVGMLPDPSVLVAFGRRTLLTHGDALCLADADYQRFRAEVRAARWQQDFLARPLDERRQIARGLRDASAARQRALPSADYADVDVQAALRLMTRAKAPTLIHGHTHRPASEQLATNAIRHVLSDWDFDHPSMRRGDVLRLTSDGVQRTSPRAVA